MRYVIDRINVDIPMDILMHDLGKILKIRGSGGDDEGGEDTKWRESRYTEKDWLLNQNNSSYSGSYIEIKNNKRNKYNYNNYRFTQTEGIPVRQYRRDQELINMYEWDNKYSMCDYVKWMDEPDKKGEISQAKKPAEFEPKKIEENKRKNLKKALKEKCE